MQKRTAISWTLVILVCVVVAIMGAVTYPFADDIKYYCFNYELLKRIGVTNPLPDIRYIFLDDYVNSNGRLATPIYDIAVAILPRWISGVIEGLTLAAICFLIYKLTLFPYKLSPSSSNCRHICYKYSPIIISLTILLALIGFPWNDNMFLTGYYVPYMIDMVLILLCMIVFLNTMYSCKGQNWVTISIGCVGMLVVGMWHEGNALCILGPMGLIWILSPAKTRRPLAIMLLFLCLGIIYTIISPSTANRAEAVSITLVLTNWFQPYTLTKGIWLMPHLVLPVLYMAVILLTGLYRISTIKSLFLKVSFHNWLYAGIPLPQFVILQLICVLVTATNLAMGLFFNIPRAAFPGIVFSTIGMVSLTIYYVSRIKRNEKRIANGIWITSILFTMIILTADAFNIPMQMKFSDEQREVERLLGNSLDGQIFYDTTEYPHSNHYPWQWACNDYYVNYVSLHFLKYHPSNPGQYSLRLIPTALETIPASVAVNGITRLDGNFISDREPDYTDPANAGIREVVYLDEYPFLKINAEVRTASGKQDIRFFEIIPFTTAKATPAERDLFYFRPVWRSHREIDDPAVEILTVSPAKYW